MPRRGPPRPTTSVDPDPDLFGPAARPGAAPPATTGTPGESPEAPLRVDDLAQMLRAVVGGSFPPLWVAGEVTQFTRHRNGHWYFTLKGAQASLRCVMWASNTWRVPTAPDEGMHLVVLGALDVFTGRTELQFVVRTMQAQGDGLWRKAFDEVKARLAADGLLDEGRRRPLPFFPRRVAIVTSPDGAALQDILSVGRRRNPLVEFVLVPAQVQGQDAARSLRLALERCYRWGRADLVIIGRGGGSREDLWCFNDEKLARAVAQAPVPVISAVGHEVDVTICDLVADFRAPTPSAAAERAVPVLDDLHREVGRLARRLVDDAQGLMRDRRRSLGNMAQRARLAATALGDRRRLTLHAAAGRLQALSPLATLGRGYVAATDARGEAVRSVMHLAPGDALHLRFVDGTALADVRRIDPVRDGTT